MNRIVLLASLLLVAAGCATDPNQAARNSYDCKLAPLAVAKAGGTGKDEVARIDQIDARAQLNSMPYYQRNRMARMGAPYNLEDAAYGCP
jgi:hypothetical protein